MKYKLQDLIEIKQIQMLQDRLNEIKPFPSSIIDIDGHVLTITGWQEVCTRFHRKNQECERECLKSDQYIASHLAEAKPAVSYRCPHGLVDNAAPIIIDGVHYGNFFTGQFFMEPPDLDFFRQQAQKYGFEEQAYLEAVQRVPIWSQSQLESYLFFVKGLIEVICSIGLKSLREAEARQKIEETEKRANTILSEMHDSFWVADMEGNILDVNPAMCQLTGYGREELLGMPISQVDVHDSPALIVKNIQLAAQNGSFQFETRFRRKDGRIVDIDTSITFLPDSRVVFGFHRDITERKLAEAALRASETKFRAIFENSVDAIGVSKMGVHVFANPAYLALFGYSASDELAGKPILELIAPEQREQITRNVQRRARGEAVPAFYETRGMRKDGTQFEMDVHVSNYEINGEMFTLVFIRDITEEKRVEEALRYLSLHDTLTGIYNRAFFETELKRLERSRDFPVSIVFGDLDNLKTTNDRLGHAAGDELLKCTVQVLQETFRAADILARIGGDEFAILLPHTDAATVEQMVERVHTNLEEQNTRRPDLPVLLSLGAATAEQGKLMEAFASADRRMYANKSMRKQAG